MPYHGRTCRTAVVVEREPRFFRPLLVRLRQHLRRHVDPCQRPAVAASPAELEQPVAQRVVGAALHVRVERRDHPVAGRVGVLAVELQHLATDHLGNPRRRQLGRGAVQLRQHGLGHRGLVLGRRDEVEVEHAAEHVVAAHAGVRRAAHRVVVGRRRQHAGQRRGLRDVDVLERLAEVDLRCRRDAVGALSEEHLVQEQRHDLFFRELLFYLPGEEGLAQLAREQAFAGQEVVARELLGDRAAALAARARAQVVDGGAQDADRVDAGVAEETAVLGGDEGIDDEGLELVVADQDAATLAHFLDQAAVAAVHAQRDLQRDLANRLGRRQAGGYVIPGADDGRGQRQRAARGEARDETRDTQATAATRAPVLVRLQFVLFHKFGA